jgi:hypothetical protein
MLDQDQLYQLGSLHAHSKSQKNQRKAISQANEQIKLLEEQNKIVQEKLKSSERQQDFENRRMQDDRRRQIEHDNLEKLRRERLNSVRNLLVDAGAALDRIEGQLGGIC